MRSSDLDEIEADFAALHEVVSRIVAHAYDALTTPERLMYLDKLELEARRLVVSGHQLINQLAEQSDPTELGGKLSHALADRLRITPPTRPDEWQRPPTWDHVAQLPANPYRHC